jgi:hypothetical protein
MAGSLFGEIINWIPKPKYNPKYGDKILMHFKVFYNMLTFIQQYRPELISPTFQESLAFHQLQTLEECQVCIPLDTDWPGYWFIIKEEDYGFQKIAYQFNKCLLLGPVSQHQQKLPDKVKEQLNGSNYLASGNFISYFNLEEIDQEIQLIASENVCYQTREKTKIFLKQIRDQHKQIEYIKKREDHAENLLNTIQYQLLQYWMTSLQLCRGLQSQICRYKIKCVDSKAKIKSHCKTL